MDNEEVKYLAMRYLEGTATAEEKTKLHDWYTGNLTGGEEVVITAEDESSTEVKNRLYQKIKERIGTDIEKISVVKLWPRISMVAATVTAIVIGVWFFSAYFMNDHHPELVSESQYDIGPGSNKATLTLANGKIINLSDVKTGVVIGNDKLVYNDGTQIKDLTMNGRHPDLEEAAKQIFSGSQTGKVTMLTASTPRGGTYQVTLPDGTKVWLNADSKISFPSQFSSKERKILLLNGEAYFEVYKNKKVPFIVETNKQEVEVLGTHFNINAYPEEGSIKTTLLEGSVRVSFLSSRLSSLSSGANAKDLDLLRRAREKLGSSDPRSNKWARDDGQGGKGGESIILKPNQQSILLSSSGRQAEGREGRISIKDVNATEAIDWKNGEFIFKGESLQSVMRRVARWYNIEVIYANDVPQDIVIGGYVSRSRPISFVLERMEQAGQVKFKIEGNKVFVNKKIRE